MRKELDKLVRSKVVVWYAVAVVFVLFCIGAAIVSGRGDSAGEQVGAQTDKSPALLMVTPGGNGISSQDAAAALQSPGSSSGLGASGSTQSSLMGQTGVSLQAGTDGITPR